MEELTASLAGAFNVSNIPNNTAAQHPRFSQYKAKGCETSQEKRRRRILKSQKSSRFDFVQHVRRLAENVWDNENDEDEDHEESQMDTSGQAKSSNKGRRRRSAEKSTPKKDDTAMELDIKHYRPGRYYKDQLMLSEWMVEVPENFSTDWMMVLCPVGRRNFVIASGGITTSYSKGGWTINTFTSNLPGGNKCKGGWRKEVTLLDTVFNEVTNTYYVLDMMCWREMPLYDTDTEFRFYWLHDKLSELGNLITTSNKPNPYRFEPLPNFSCDAESIRNIMQTKTALKLDGLLFYHKKAPYLCGSTPLVLWLKAYMLPDILNIDIPESLLSERPASYTTFQAHTEKVEADKIKEEIKVRKRAEKYRRSKDSMEGMENVQETVVAEEASG